MTVLLGYWITLIPSREEMTGAASQSLTGPPHGGILATSESCSSVSVFVMPKHEQLHVDVIETQHLMSTPDKAKP